MPVPPDGPGPNGPYPVRVRSIVIDDSRAVRARLASLLREAGVHVLADTDDGKAAISLVQELSPDVVLLDLSMPKMPGIDVLRALTRLRAPPRVIVLTNHASEAYRAECLRLGAAGFLDKSRDLDRIVDAVKRGTTSTS